MTEKLFYKDSHIKEFEAVVVSCEGVEKNYKTELDKTAFFPEGGGQPGDTGTINGVKVIDTIETGEHIYHITESAIETGTKVNCRIDWERRFGLMQNHSGEHIVSGIVHAMFGYNNVGFHIGDEYVTIDFDGELTDEDIANVEKRANAAVFENREVRIYYPTPEELGNFDYRSKLDITENVRLVEIDGYDLCACCAPHVYKTGEIGLIKLLDAMRHRGGMRINMICGFGALDDYNTKYANVAEISAALSAKQHETAKAVQRLKSENASLKAECASLKKELVKLKAEKLQKTEGNICIFENDLSSTELRELVNAGMELCGGVCAGFTGNDTDGYNYVIGSKSVDLRKVGKAINNAINGRGGGQPGMIQGSAKAEKEVITEYFKNNTLF